MPYFYLACSGLPRSGKNKKFSRSGKSLNFFISRKFLIFSKSVKSQGNLFTSRTKSRVKRKEQKLFENEVRNIGGLQKKPKQM